MNYPSFFSHAGLCLDREDLSQGHTTPLHFVRRLIKRKTSTKELSVCVWSSTNSQMTVTHFADILLTSRLPLVSRIAALSSGWCSVNMVYLIRHCSGDTLPSMFQMCVSSDTPDLNDQPVSWHYNEAFITIREGRPQDLGTRVLQSFSFIRTFLRPSWPHEFSNRECRFRNWVWLQGLVIILVQTGLLMDPPAFLFSFSLIIQLFKTSGPNWVIRSSYNNF